MPTDVETTETVTAEPQDSATLPAADSQATTEPNLEDLRALVEKLRLESESAQKRISELNKESASRRKKLEEYEKAQEEAARAQMNDVEKAQADLQKWQQKATEQESKYAELEERFNKFRTTLALEREAAKLGFAHPQDAVALVDLSTLTVAEDGNVTGFEKQLDELAKSGRLPMREVAVGTPQPGKKPQAKSDKPDTTIQTLMQKHRL